MTEKILGFKCLWMIEDEYADASSWEDVLAFYSEASKTHRDWVPIRDLVMQIMESKYRQIFYPLRTMNGLLLSQTPKIRWHRQNLLISPGEKLTFEYQDSLKSHYRKGVDTWVRQCEPKDSFKLIIKFVDQLHLLVEEK